MADKIIEAMQMATKKSKKKIQFRDMGEKPGGISDRPYREKKVYYPDIYLDTKRLPELAGVDAGQHIILAVKAYVRKHSISEDPNKKEETFTLELRKMAVVKKNKT